MQVGAADPDRRRLDHDVERPGGRVGDVLDLERAGSDDDGCLHLTGAVLLLLTLVGRHLLAKAIMLRSELDEVV